MVADKLLVGVVDASGSPLELCQAIISVKKIILLNESLKNCDRAEILTSHVDMSSLKPLLLRFG